MSPFLPLRPASVALAAALALLPFGASAQDVLDPPQLPLIVPVAPPPPARPLPMVTQAQADQLVAILQAAADEGLPVIDPVPAGPALVQAALDHARALRTGRLPESGFRKDWGLRPAYFDPYPGFMTALAQDRLPAWFASLTPPYAGYDGLRRGLARYREIAANGGWPTLAAGPDLTTGSTGPRVLALRRRLAIEDDQVAAAGDTYDAELVEAVRRAQRRYGLVTSGVVAAQTLAALNVPVAERIDQVAANMERWRWIPRELATDRVQVNIAAAVLTVFEGDTPVSSMRAVTGRPGDETPMLQSTIHSIVINPPWNVPSSIATRELWPKERARPGYLKRSGFRVIKLPDGGSRLQQAAGSRSALGRLKFDFDNPYAVYLHDTPSQATFQRNERLASHGCVRLEKPVDLAALLFRDDPAWSEEAICAAIDKGTTRRVQLGKPVSVYLFYWTTFASANGQMSFRADPYGWDRILAERIDAPPAPVKSPASDAATDADG